MDIALVVQGIDRCMQPGRWLVIIQKRVQEAALIVFAGDTHGAQGVEIADPIAMYLHPHTERLAQMRDLHQRRDPADIPDAAAADICCSADDPLGAGLELALSRLWAADREAQLLGEPDIGRDAVL